MGSSDLFWTEVCRPDHFRCVKVCYHTHTPQRTRPDFAAQPLSLAWLAGFDEAVGVGSILKIQVLVIP